MCDYITYKRMTEIATTLFSYLSDNEMIEDAIEDRDLDLSEEEMMFFLGISKDDIKRARDSGKSGLLESIRQWNEAIEKYGYIN